MASKSFKQGAPRQIMGPEMERIRAEKMAAPHPCYNGQWTVHESHTYTLYVQAWLGGGTETVTCPGKTEDTRLK